VFGQAMQVDLATLRVFARSRISVSLAAISLIKNTLWIAPRRTVWRGGSRAVMFPSCTSRGCHQRHRRVDSKTAEAGAGHCAHRRTARQPRDLASGRSKQAHDREADGRFQTGFRTPRTKMGRRRDERLSPCFASRQPFSRPGDRWPPHRDSDTKRKFRIKTLRRRPRGVKRASSAPHGWPVAGLRVISLDSEHEFGELRRLANRSSAERFAHDLVPRNTHGPDRGSLDLGEP
jgi:hypothetical protein